MMSRTTQLAAGKALKMPARLLEKLCEIAVPATSSGAVWVPSALAESEFMASYEQGGVRQRIKESFGKARYVAPAELNYELPKRGAPEVAFVGRSNVGKSSLLGKLCRDPSICRRSKRPGCTTTVNFYTLGGKREAYFVDLPGYGFAKRSDAERETFSAATLAYLGQRDAHVLRHVALLIDARRGLALDKDAIALEAFHRLQIPHHVVLTKADLVKPHELALAVAGVFTKLAQNTRLSSCLPVVHVSSARTGFGIPELRDYMTDFVSDSLLRLSSSGASDEEEE